MRYKRHLTLVTGAAKRNTSPPNTRPNNKIPDGVYGFALGDPTRCIWQHGADELERDSDPNIRRI